MSQVENYINKQGSKQRKIALRLREIILKTYPDIVEEFKMGVPWYEGKFYIKVVRDHVNLGFSVKGLSEEEKELFDGKGEIMRHIKVFSLQQIDGDGVVNLLKLVKEK